MTHYRLIIIFFLFSSIKTAAQSDSAKYEFDRTDLYNKAIMTFIDSSSHYPFPTIKDKKLDLVLAGTPIGDNPIYYNGISIKYYINESPKNVERTAMLTAMANEGELIVLGFSVQDDAFKKKNNLIFSDIGFVNIYFKFNCSTNRHELYKLDYRINWIAR